MQRPEGYRFEVTGTLTYDRENDTMWLDVQELLGRWPFGADVSAVTVKGQCVQSSC